MKLDSMERKFEGMRRFLDDVCQSNPIIARDITYIIKGFKSNAFGMPLDCVLGEYWKRVFICNYVYEKHCRNKDFGKQFKLEEYVQ